MSDYYLPQEIAKLLTDDRLKNCKNLGLILDKYPPQSAVQKSEDKGTWLKGFESDTHIDVKLAENVYQRWLKATQAIEGVHHFSATTDWRMVVGLGGETVLETDLTLHHLYGIPFIPGSALKGLTRAYAAIEDKEMYVKVKDSNKLEPSKKPDDDHADIKRIFGTQKDAGTVIFFDAMPTNGKVDFDLDIMNAHYPNYYGEKKLPTNDQNPNPVTFLTVTNTTFTFALAPRRYYKDRDKEDVDKAKGWLQAALKEYGVGGKTSAGYGYFTISKQQEDTHAATSMQMEPASPVGVQNPAPPPYIRPNIPKFATGQGISGTVVGPTDELHRREPEAKAFLKYRELSTKMVLMIVTAEEAATWLTGQTRNCLFVSEEERDGCTVLICQPGASKKKKG